MKLGTLKEGGRDGTLIVVSRDLVHAVRAGDIAPTLQAALDDWQNTAPRLHALYDALCLHRHKAVQHAFELDFNDLASPLPRASPHMVSAIQCASTTSISSARVAAGEGAAARAGAAARRVCGAQVPESFYTDPLMYQATSAGFLGPCDPVRVPSEDYGIDLEAEVVVVTDDVPMAVTPEQASEHIQLVGLVNDVSLRALIPNELAKGFGFLQSKPRSALSPVLVTPDELREAWREDKLHLPMRTWINGKWFGEAEAGEDMQFNFAQLVAHAARTRPLTAGTIVGSGTIANQDTSKGASCLAEQRTVETLRDGKPSTPFLKYGDLVKIEMLDVDGNSIFGAIEQRIEAPLAK